MGAARRPLARFALGAAWLIVALAAAACTKDASELAPFPCAQDKTCPAPLVCTSGICGPVQADSSCVAGRADCASVGDICWEGHVCEQSCTTSAGCPLDRTCVAGACLLDCTADGRCPVDLECHLVDTGPTRACMPPTIYVPACQSFSPRTARECFPMCPNNNLFCTQNTSPCYCPENSRCTGMNNNCYCSCSAGWAGMECATGQYCSTCTNAWYCVWPLAPSSCTTAAPGPGTCTCRNGATIERGCTTTPCEDLCLQNQIDSR